MFDLGTVSVIVPVYNVEHYLHQCVESVLKQTYSNLEVILVDDGSTDASSSLCDQFAAQDQRVQTLHQRNAGLSAARNTGLDLCHGEWITFVDSDDYLSPGFIEGLLSRVPSDARAIVSGSIVTVDSSGHPVASFPPTMVRAPADAYRAYFSMPMQIVSPWARLYSADIWRELRFPVGRWHEDEWVFHEVWSQGQVFAESHGSCYYYRQRPNSIMHHRAHPKRLHRSLALLRRSVALKNMDGDLSSECARLALADATRTMWALYENGGQSLPKALKDEYLSFLDETKRAGVRVSRLEEALVRLRLRSPKFVALERLVRRTISNGLAKGKGVIGRR